MTKYFCDFKNCDNVVEDQRKINLARHNPWQLHSRFHACNYCLLSLKNYLTDNLRSEEVV